MDRKEITRFLSDLLERDKLSGVGKYYASEVVLDYGTRHPKRIDYLQYVPNGATYTGDIERGYFISYEIKSCRDDVYSGYGLNFIAENNFIVTTVECYKSLMPDMRDNKLTDHIRKVNNGIDPAFNFLLAVPDKIDPQGWNFSPHRAIANEIEHTTPLDEWDSWRLAKMSFCGRDNHRRRSTTELLFCMLRSGR